MKKKDWQWMWRYKETVENGVENEKIMKKKTDKRKWISKDRWKQGDWTIRRGGDLITSWK